jgi:hypothetical protein
MVTSSGEQSGSLAQAEEKLRDRGYASTSDRREIVTAAMHVDIGFVRQTLCSTNEDFPNIFRITSA